MAKLVKVKLEKIVGCEACSGQPGDIVAVEEKDAKALVKAGLAIDLTPAEQKKEAEKEKETATDKKENAETA